MPASLSGNLSRNNTRLQQIRAEAVPILCPARTPPPGARRHRAMTDRVHADGVAELVEALLEGYAPISVLLEHMVESPSRPTVDEVRAVLGALLRDTLDPLATTFG